MTKTNPPGKPYTIELDCPPGDPRPNHLLPQVLADTGITLDPEEPDSKFFGNWRWTVPEEQREQYEQVREQIMGRIKELYTLGTIRYGSW